MFVLKRSYLIGFPYSKNHIGLVILLRVTDTEKATCRRAFLQTLL